MIIIESNNNFCRTFYRTFRFFCFVARDPGLKVINTSAGPTVKLQISFIELISYNLLESAASQKLAGKVLKLIIKLIICPNPAKRCRKLFIFFDNYLYLQRGNNLISIIPQIKHVVTMDLDKPGEECGVFGYIATKIFQHFFPCMITFIYKFSF